MIAVDTNILVAFHRTASNAFGRQTAISAGSPR